MCVCYENVCIIYIPLIYHDPTHDILHHLHNPSLPGGGKIAYQGPARLAMGWFASLGYIPHAPSQMPQSNPTAPSAGASPQPKAVVTNATDFLLDCTSGHIKRQRQGPMLGQGLGKEGEEEVDDSAPVVWHELWSKRGQAYLSGAMQQEGRWSDSQESSQDDWVASAGEYSGGHDTIPPPRTAKIDKEVGGGVKHDSVVQRAATVKVRSFPRQLLLYFVRAFLQRIKGFDMVSGSI